FGGQNVDVIVEAGGQLDVYGSAFGTNNYGTTILESGAVGNIVQVYSGIEIVSSGALDTNALIYAEQDIRGSVVNATVYSGGSQLVSSGGTTSGTTVSSGGFEYVSSGGVASGTVVTFSGSETVSSGGINSGAIVDSGGQAFI